MFRGTPPTHESRSARIFRRPRGRPTVSLPHGMILAHCRSGRPAAVPPRASTSVVEIVRSGSAAHRDRLCRRRGRGGACTPARGRQAGDLKVTVPGWRGGTVVASAAGSGGFPAKHHSRWRWSRRSGRAEETERRRELGPDWLTLEAAVCLTALERSVGVRASASVPEWCSTTARVEGHSCCSDGDLRSYRTVPVPSFIRSG